ncbi:hypothetical protein PTSG_09162 [Salpingoeca rosetta]|uniref:Hint domain-containing protein n=1 Tax=Salpingoeca rosetta (strain ATCC 50818 / BSB-021) TaxID=946362 RepID=F2UMW8_SALR5|nr:uncharacterized protein PTSG_09162 [Salpingoeca rosetta]EGD78467.1 hypothetical protein PTSG_09162 [Salpingoeca rosetta]|eukprot:XP_004989416.1 hypothetical protein PTSG_09162 [Salpingoeca rosetta]
MDFTGLRAVRLALFVAAAVIATTETAHALLDLGDELTLSEFLNDAGIDGCAALTASPIGYYFQSGHATGLSRSRCTLGGTCQCRHFEACANGDCLKVYRCNDTESSGCVAVSPCSQSAFNTTLEATVRCRKPLDQRDEDSLNFFAMRWKQALETDCGIGRTLQTDSNLNDIFTHGCSARLQGSGADCPVVLTNPTSTNPTCFPGWAEVILESGERVQLRNLKTGDRVLCLQASAGNALGYCELKTFQHVELNGTTTSVELHYTDKDGNPALMSATPDHFVFRADEDVHLADGLTVQPAGEFIFAGDFAVGDRLLRYDVDLGVMYTVTITSISFTIEPDYFTPLTDDGSTLFVEDVFASSFALLESPDVIRLVLAPIWQNDDDRFTEPTAGKDFPEGLHPFTTQLYSIFLAAEMSGQTIDVEGMATAIAQQLAVGHVFTQQEMLQLVPNYIN